MIERDSDTWRIVAALIAAELAKMTKLILSRNVSHDDSNYYRGYVAALKRVKELEQRGDTHDGNGR